MKIKLLREYIRNILLEGGAPDSSGVAAIQDNSSENTVVILFRYDILYKELNKSRTVDLSIFLANALQKCVVAFGSFGMPEEGKAFGSWQVYNAAGEGYGKILYGMGYALSPSGLLMPDRLSVSPKAANAWYKASQDKKRKAYKLDNLPPNNKTKTTVDDSVLLNKPDKEYLDYAYGEAGWEESMTKKILRLGDAAIEEVVSMSNGNLNHDMVKNIIIEIGKEVFIQNIHHQGDYIDF